MAIEVSCHCGRVIRVKDDQAGKRGHCPQCGAVIVVPDLPPGQISATQPTMTPVPPPPTSAPQAPVVDLDDPPQIDDDSDVRTYADKILARMLNDQLHYHTTTRGTQLDTSDLLEGIASNVKRLTFIANVFFYIWIVIPAVLFVPWLLIYILS